MDATMKVPSVWTVLFWKEFRQLWPACGAILLGMFVLQLMCLLQKVIDSRAFNQIEQIPIVIALISPFVVVMAAGGMLMGHERQSGSWAWSSSLPISWQTTLFVKVATTVGSVLLTLLPLLGFALLVEQFFGSAQGGQVSSWALETYGTLFAFSVLGLAGVVFLTMPLLFRETLLALIIGMVLLMILEGIVFYIPAVLGDWDRLAGDPIITPFVFVEMAIAITLMGLAMAASYRWRWGTGQFSNLSIRRTSGPLAAAPALIRHGAAPSEWRSLFRLGWKSSFAFRCILMCCAILISFVGVSNTIVLPLMIGPLLFVIITLLGISTFEGSQSRRRFRFLADRGITPVRILAGLALAPTLLSLVVCLIFFSVWFFGQSSEFSLAGSFAVVVVWCFLCGCFASLCFERPIISSTICCMTLAVSYIIVGLTTGLQWESVRIGDPMPYWLTILSVAFFMILGLPALVWQLYQACKTWLVLDRPNLTGRYFVVSTLVILLPLAIATSTGFLLIPKVPWHGIAPGGSNLQTVFGPSLDVSEDLIPSRSLNVRQFAVYGEGKYADSYSSIIEAHSDNWDAESVARRLEELKRIDASQTLPQVPILYFEQLNEHLMETAVLAVYLLEQGRSKDALAALKSHAKVQKLACEVSCVRTAACRLSALALLDKWLNPRLLSNQIDRDELSSILIPDLKDAKPELIQVAKAEAGWFRESIRGNSAIAPLGIENEYYYPIHWISAYVPPIRWRHERVLASHLAQTLYAIRSGPDSIVDAESDWFGIHLRCERRIQVLRRNLRYRIYQASPSEVQTGLGGMDGSLSYGGEQIEHGTVPLELNMEVEMQSDVSERPPSPQRE